MPEPTEHALPSLTLRSNQLMLIVGHSKKMIIVDGVDDEQQVAGTLAVLQHAYTLVVDGAEITPASVAESIVNGNLTYGTTYLLTHGPLETLAVLDALQELSDDSYEDVLHRMVRMLTDS